jgi:hypothetical protein
MLQTHPILLEALTKTRQAEYLRHAERYRQALAPTLRTLPKKGGEDHAAHARPDGSRCGVLAGR